MKAVMKKALILVACLCLLTVWVSAQAPALVTEPLDSVITPMNTHILTTSTYLDVSGKTATMSASMRAVSSVTKCEISATLQRLQNGTWVNVKTFTASDNTYYTALSETYTVTSGYSYRLATTFKAYVNGSLVESFTKYAYS